LSKAQYLDVDDRSEDLRDLMRHDRAVAHDFMEKFDLSWLYHDNGLEGIVFTSLELEQAFDDNLVAADASVLPILNEIRNHKRAIDFVREEAKAKRLNINLALIKKLYELLGEGFPGRDKAIFRKDMPLHRTYFHDIDQPGKIVPHLDRLIDYTKTREFKEFHPVQQAATLQWTFMQIFPFTENSGKIARLLSNLIFLRAGYLPAVIHAIDRQRYYEVLRQPAANLRQFLIEAMENSLENAFKFFREAHRSRVRKAM
jgi:Fic family protein